MESLTGYISRLAAAHSLETGVLVNHELLPRIPYTKGISAGQVRVELPSSFYIDAHTLNGIGDCSRLWVSLLEQLTCIQRLDLLTTLPWAHVISCVHLLRTTRAWCHIVTESKVPLPYMNGYCGHSRSLPFAPGTGAHSIRSVLPAAERSMCSPRSPGPATVPDANAG